MLYDQYGQPIDTARLKKVESAASLTGVRTLRRRYSSAGIEPQELGRVMRRADDGDMVDYLELAEEIEEKDGHYVGVLKQRKEAVCGLPITVEAAGKEPRDEEMAQMVRDFIERETLYDDLFDILDAVGKGFSASEIIWDTKSEPGKWLVDRLDWVDPRHLQFDRETGQVFCLRTEQADPDPLTPYKYVTHRVRSKSGLPVRAGVIRPVSWLWLYKNFAVGDWVVHAETYGQPIRVGKYGPGSTEADREILLRAVADLGSDAGVMIPDSMIIEFVKDATLTASADLFERLSRWCDEQISKAVLGQTTTTDSLSGGGIAGNEAHNDVRGDIVDADARALTATLNNQLVKPMINLNFGLQRKYPRIIIRRPESVNVPVIQAAMTAFVNAGGKISAKRMGNMLGLPVAEDNEEVLSPPQPAAYPGMMSERHAPGEVVLASQPRQQPDEIDAAADELAGDWEEIMTPMIEALDGEAAASSDLKAFSERLLELAAQDHSGKLVEALEKAIGTARLAGNLNVKLK